MKTFMAVYIGSDDSLNAKAWEKLDEKSKQDRQRQGMQAWMAWGQKYAAAIVDHGAPLGKTIQAGPNGIASMRNALTAYTIVKAESHQAAAEMFLNHPHFTIFPGDSVEIMECLPIPKM